MLRSARPEVSRSNRGRARSVLLTALLAAACVPGEPAPPPPPPAAVDGQLPPNVILVVTDDQSVGSMRGDPVAMPWLRKRLTMPGWTTFTNAVISTPMCCPSRATILTGRYARTTGVRSNDDGRALDDAETLAVWLHDAGYRTAMIGKYLNGYPWEGEPVVPDGWDRWFAKLNLSAATTYVGYDVIDDGARSTVGSAPADYATDRLAAEALAFVREAPHDRPFFLYLAPSAPHSPWEPAPRHLDLLVDPSPVAADPTELAEMNDVVGLPGWVGALPPVDADRAAELEADRRAERATLRAVDDALRRIWGEVVARGQQDRTALFLLSDNGFAYGDHRWVGKACPWESCIGVPFVARVPGTPGGRVEALVANIDVAPTIAELAGSTLPEVDGVSLLDVLRGGPAPAREAVLLDWVGRDDVPAWVGVRLQRAVYVRHADGTRELYRLDRDPRQRANLITDPRAAGLLARAERLLADSLVAVGDGG